MKKYLEDFCAEFDYPEEACEALAGAYDTIFANEKAAETFSQILEDYDKTRLLDFHNIKEQLNEAAELTGVHEYTVKLLIHILLSKTLRKYYAEKGLDDSLWFGAMSDLKWKLIECHIVKDVWGTFVADWNWFSRWYDITRVAIGRLQFEIINFKREYEKETAKMPSLS